MNEKEVGEIRRTLTTERTTITAVHGCYVNADKEIITTFRRPLSEMSADEAEKYLALFKKTLSGGIDRNLIDIPFSTAQVANSEEHALLTQLRESELGSADAISKFFLKIAGAHESEENYCILLAMSSYDVPYRGKDGAKYEDAGSEVYRFLSCAICPVKPTKAALAYAPGEKNFRNYSGDNTICAPEAGFLFPTFDDRKTNIYSTLFYTRSTKEAHDDLTAALFGGEIKSPAAEQNANFGTMLAQTLGDACKFETVRAVRETIAQRIEDHKESRVPEPLVMTQSEVREVLELCGAPAEKLAECYEEQFGAGTDLIPKNIINTRKFELKTPEVTIKVAKGGEHLVQTKVIDGVKYILIRADQNAEFNGINIFIEE